MRRLSNAVFVSLLIAALPLATASMLAAGDHTDSPNTRSNQTADLADVYVFVVPSKSAGDGPRVVMMMTAFSNASGPVLPDLKVPAKRPGTRFSDSVEYVFRLRPAEISGSGPDTRVATDGKRELKVTCSFDDAMFQRVECVTSAPAAPAGKAAPLRASAAVDDTAGGGPEHFRLFAGACADPFFTDPGKLLYNYLKLPQLASGILEPHVMEGAESAGFLKAAEQRVLKGILEKIPDEPEYDVIARPRDEDNDWWSWPKFIAAAARGRAQWLPIPTAFIRDANVLAIVVELELGKAYGRPVSETLFTLAAETFKQGHRIDRDARPTLLNLLFAKSVPYPLAEQSIPDLAALQDRWNQDDTFDLDGEALSSYTAALQTGMSLYDGSDGVADWPAPHPMLPVMLTDAILFDATKTTTPSSDRSTYFEIEMSTYLGNPPRTGGGRTPNDDTIDTFLTWFVNGPERVEPRRTDGEDRPSSPATDVFPYLRPPHQSE